MAETEVLPTLNAADEDAIKEIVCEILEIEPDEMTREGLFKDDHDADSLSSIEILSALERKFGVEIDQAKLTEMVSLDGVIGVVAEAKSQQ